MNQFWSLLCIVILFSGCLRSPSPKDTSNRLKATMSDFLQKATAKSPAATHFDVMDVSWYEDSTFFECEFKVHMTGPGQDTTGIMTARIARDFSKVVRKE